MRKITGRIGTVAVVLAVLLAGAGPVSAQGFFEEYDPLVIIPEVLIIVDTSGSMTSGSYSCGDGSYTCDRRRAVREVLTGTYQASPPATGCPAQLDDGILDEYKGQLRVGIATFDDERWWCDNSAGGTTYNYPETGSGDSVAGGGNLGIKGRNDANGGLVDVVDPANPNALLLNNDRVQMAACLTTADSCTPLNAALADAYYYFTNWHAETSYTDDIAHCRPKFVLLMTDGQNNGPLAYYGTPEEEAAKLYNDLGIITYVVGFGGGLEAWVNPIARAGSGNTLDAFTADNPDELRTQFEAIFQAILAGAGTRTEVASTPSHLDVGKSYAYKAGFQISNSWLGWQGALFRYKVEDTDDDGIPEVDTSNPLEFHTILENSDANQRRILTVTHNPRRPGPLVEFRSGDPSPDYLMCLGDRRERNCTATGDVEVCEVWDIVQGACLRTDIKSCNTDADCTGLPCTDLQCKECTATDPVTGDCTAWNTEEVCVQWENTQVCNSWETRTECIAWDDVGDVSDLADTIKDYVRGVPGTPARGGAYEMPGPMMGDIFHSDPVVVPPPSALSDNYKYETHFRRYYNRDTMVYVGANDGMLHAFVGEDNNPDDGNREGRELWAFIPNNLLAKIQKVRWGHYFFVDGTPVVRDVYFNNIQATDIDGKPMVVGGKKVMGAYRTVLIVGERRGGSAYFALDVSDPDDPQYLWEYRTNVLPTLDYGEHQCKESVLETRAKPIVGSVWLKKANPAADEDPYIAKSVAILPDGYVSAPTLMSVSSCVEFVELVLGATSFNVVDIENGKLLKKFAFAGEDMQDNLDKLQDYYDRLQSGDTKLWDETFEGGGNDTPNGWAWGAEMLPSDGWFCREHRANIQIPIVVPPEQMTTCHVWQDDDVKYVLHCCCKYDGGTGGCDQTVACNPNAGGSCLYEYTKYKNVPGGLVLKKKGECMDDKGNMELRIAKDFGVESVSGTPAAYNTTQGEFITRVFVPTSKGNIWRVDLSNGEYDETAPEGRMIGPYTAGGVTYDWDISRDGTGNPVPWFSVNDSLPQCAGRPVTVTPTLALNYNRNLVVFVGTGDYDETEYYDTQDCFYAVEETRSEISGNFLVDPQGSLFGTPGTILFNTAERLFHKPLVAGGHVVIATYTPNEDLCEPGDAHYYGYRFDDFSPTEKIIDFGETGTGPPQAPKMMWTPTGPEVVVGISKTTGLKRVGIGEHITPAAHVLHWARVL